MTKFNQKWFIDIGFKFFWTNLTCSFKVPIMLFKMSTPYNEDLTKFSNIPSLFWLFQKILGINNVFHRHSLCSSFSEKMIGRSDSGKGGWIQSESISQSQSVSKNFSVPRCYYGLWNERTVEKAYVQQSDAEVLSALIKSRQQSVLALLCNFQ